MKIRNDGPSANRLSPVPRSKYVAIGGSARTSTSRAGRPSNPSAYRASHASSGTRTAIASRTGEDPTARRPCPSERPIGGMTDPPLCRKARPQRPTRFGRRGRLDLGLGRFVPNRGRPRSRGTASLLSAHGASSGSGSRSRSSSPVSPSATTARRRVAQMPGRNATAKTITAASAHRVSVVRRRARSATGRRPAYPAGRVRTRSARRRDPLSPR